MLSEAKHPYGLGFSRGTGCFGGPQHDISLVKLRIAVGSFARWRIIPELSTISGGVN
jgi:hypothetical protein